MQKILIIDDDEGVCYSLARLLSNDERRVTAVQTPEAGFEALRGEDPDLVLLDVKIPGADGLELLRTIRKQRPRQLVVMMTAHGTTETAIEAMKRGAYDYLMKPFDPDVLNTVVVKALDNARLNKRVSTGLETVLEKKTAAADKSTYSDRIIGQSATMHDVCKKIGQVAPREVPVLIRGESGTGKELVARALWQHSKRAVKPFLAVNCAAIPETLLEGELFGHEKGSFTGAESRKLGKFEQADEGTLFLDEVGDMSIATQAKILRVLQNNTFERVGGTETIKVDVRIIAATHQNLERFVKEGKFREDLYYRLRVMEITLPSLRERRDDIPELVKYFISRHREALLSEATGISPKALEALANYDWPGNIRQLENVIRRAMVLCNGSIINIDHLEFGPEGSRVSEAVKPTAAVTAAPTQQSAPPANGASPAAQPVQTPAVNDMDYLVEKLLSSGKASLIEDMERLLIGRALEKLNGNQLQTAKLLGITRNTLRSRIEKYGLRPKVKVM
ncbi:MAG TPA: sigma-54 dependent transcriptional regulator [Planctomycetota bacterium]|nr:sigma-54 dependent transcriptional regulator [Planctomycetota bacterium]